MSKLIRIPTSTLLLGFALGIAGGVPVQAAGLTERVSVNSAGQEGNGLSRFQSSSVDGRYVAFWSEATNLVPNDGNGQADIFVRDRITQTTFRVNVDSSGQEANAISYTPLISANGRYVAFHSQASNLVPNDTNQWADVFVHDLVTGATSRVSVDSSGAEANGDSFPASISADGRFIAFASEADNLVTGDTNKLADVFIHDRLTGQTERVSVDSSGQQANKGTLYYGLVTDDGRYVAYFSESTNLVAGDTNNQMDVFVRDRQTGTTERVSVDSSGKEGNDASYIPAISSNGRYVAFTSAATNLVTGDANGRTDVFVHDRKTHKTSRVSVDSHGREGDFDSSYPGISADGRLVSFYSAATNLVPQDSNGKQDIFLRDRASHKTSRISMAFDGREGDGDSLIPTLSGDGRYVSYWSSATNLVTGDTNGEIDVFVYDRLLDPGKTADLAVTQSDRPDPVGKNKPVVYTVTLTNHGPDEAQDATLIDIPSSFATVLSFRDSQWQCTHVNKIVCRFGTLAAGQSATLTLKLRPSLTQDLPEQLLVNQVFVQAAPRDPDPANNSSSETTIVHK